MENNDWEKKIDLLSLAVNEYMSALDQCVEDEEIDSILHLDSEIKKTISDTLDWVAIGHYVKTTPESTIVQKIDGALTRLHDHYGVVMAKLENLKQGSMLDFQASKKRKAAMQVYLQH